jgi:hypothetical protein
MNVAGCKISRILNRGAASGKPGAAEKEDLPLRDEMFEPAAV